MKVWIDENYRLLQRFRPGGLDLHSLRSHNVDGHLVVGFGRKGKRGGGPGRERPSPP
jgi:hypothetical protein